jgi:hypothetical protein
MFSNSADSIFSIFRFRCNGSGLLSNANIGMDYIFLSTETIAQTFSLIFVITTLHTTHTSILHSPLWEWVSLVLAN